MAEALRQGLTRKTLYAMRDAGVIEPLSRGTYRLKDLPPLEHPDLVVVARRVPHGVVCLVSALSFHGLTTQIPHEVYVAVRRGTEPPRVDYPPIRLFVISGPAFEDGIEHHSFDGTSVAIYDPEKSIADTFKFRHKVGFSVAAASDALEETPQHLGGPYGSGLTVAHRSASLRHLFDEWDGSFFVQALPDDFSQYGHHLRPHGVRDVLPEEAAASEGEVESLRLQEILTLAVEPVLIFRNIRVGLEQDRKILPIFIRFIVPILP